MVRLTAPIEIPSGGSSTDGSSESRRLCPTRFSISSECSSTRSEMIQAKSQELDTDRQAIKRWEFPRQEGREPIATRWPRQPAKPQGRSRRAAISYQQVRCATGSGKQVFSLKLHTIDARRQCCRDTQCLHCISSSTDTNIHPATRAAGHKVNTIYSENFRKISAFYQASLQTRS